ncbi:MAG: YkgJ family cysteine cluster protein [Gemmataceae bacterium]|nr:YkgJ family cysteine cluster protein [Gemmataceae bacterium]
MQPGFEKVSLPLLQNWDCHTCGTCCKEYLVQLSKDEVEKIQGQGWDREKDLGGYSPFKRTGIFWKKTHLNHRPDGSCVFLDEKGLCKIHGRFGLSEKPLPCQVFPYVLIPAGDQWQVGVRFACPSAAKNLGTPVVQQEKDIRDFISHLKIRENLAVSLTDNKNKPQLLPGKPSTWETLYLFRDVLLELMSKESVSVELCLRRCLAFAREMKKMNFDLLSPIQVKELAEILSRLVENEIPLDPYSVLKPTWIGRVLFRQACAIYTRKDHGPNRGLVKKGRLALFGAALSFARGQGKVPRVNSFTTDITFDEVEQKREPLEKETSDFLRRYYLTKIGSLQFVGATNFQMPFWEGLHSLILTFPVVAWTAFTLKEGENQLTRFQTAVSLADDHFGFNKILGTARQRFSLGILQFRQETHRLVAWYARGKP